MGKTLRRAKHTLGVRGNTAISQRWLHTPRLLCGFCGTPGYVRYTAKVKADTRVVNHHRGGKSETDQQRARTTSPKNQAIELVTAKTLLVDISGVERGGTRRGDGMLSGIARAELRSPKRRLGCGDMGWGLLVREGSERVDDPRLASRRSVRGHFGDHLPRTYENLPAVNEKVVGR